MPPTQYSSFDRGVDTEHSEAHANPSPVLEREYRQRTPSRAPWRKFLAYSMVMIMTVSALAFVVPTGQKILGGPQTPDQVPADAEIGGTRNVSYTVSNMFEIYNKSTNYANRGAHLAAGHPMWWWDRQAAYPDTIVRNSYPYMGLYDYYSANIPASYKDPRMGFGTYSYFRLTMNAQNLTTVATGVNQDPIFIPILNTTAGLGSNGGWVNWTWRVDYLTAQETVDITAGTHYANTYYGVPAGSVKFSGGDANDGWWNELHGKMDFNKSAARKFLNLPGAGDLRTEFTTANAAGALNTAWANHWIVDGSNVIGSSKYNTYCTYDYVINSGTVDAWLTLDGTSTATKLVLRIWGHAWGYEILMHRFLESVGVGKYFQNYEEDMYFNGTAAPNGADLFVRETAVYHMLAWKDLSVFAAAWNMDTWHTDGCMNTAANPASTWASRYAPFGPATNRPQKMELSPGTVNYGTRVMYWQAPQGFNLTANEKVVIKLPNGLPGVGVTPYIGASDVIDEAKAAEIRTNSFWGEVILGHGYPSWLYSSTYYNGVTKTLTLQGPLVLNNDPNENPTYPNKNETGSPDFVFAVSKVSYYQVEMVQNLASYTTTTTYNVRVTAKNFTGVTVTNWNGTANLATNNAGTVFGSSSHLFVPGDSGVWTTTVVFGSGNSNTYINATDSSFPLDVNGACGPLNVLVIPEFGLLVLPIMGLAAIVAVVRRFVK